MFNSFVSKSKLFICTLILIILSGLISVDNKQFSVYTSTLSSFSSIFLQEAHSQEMYAQKTQNPFVFDLYINLYEHIEYNSLEKNTKYVVLTLKLTSQNGYYTYAPNQEGAYSTELYLINSLASANLSPPNLSSSDFITTEKLITLYPTGKKKVDPFNPNIEIYAYEDTQYIFLLLPENFISSHVLSTGLAGDMSGETFGETFEDIFAETFVDNFFEGLNLKFSFLACTNAHCLPREENIPLHFTNLNGENIQNIEMELFYPEFQTLFSNLSKIDSNLVVKGGRIKENIEKQALEESLTQEQNQEIIQVQNTIQIQKQSLNTAINYDFTPQPLNTSLEVQSLYKAILFGLLAGFILNFMPCVLPVIGLKIRSFLQSKKEEDTEEAKKKRLSAFREHNLFFGVGILSWFLILGFLLGVLGFSWGQIFQNPSVVLVLTLFIFAMSLSLFGLYHLPIFGSKIAHILTEKQNISSISNVNKNTVKKKIHERNSEKFSAFASGLLATLLATPCSGPLLGAVLGYSLTQPLPILLTIFLAMGFGMALPYFLFALRPSLVRFMPRAGDWLNNMEQVLGFFLVATTIYLYSLLPEQWQMPALILTFFLTISCTIWGKIGSFHSKGVKKALVGLLCVLLVFLPSLFLFKTKETKNWIDFTPQIFEERLGKELLILKFTADWCPTCKILEHTVFTAKNMQELSSKVNSDSTFIYVDLTEFEEPKQNLLKALDSVSIPLLAIFPNGKRSREPIIIRDMYTLEQVKEAIELAK